MDVAEARKLVLRCLSNRAECQVSDIEREVASGAGVRPEAVQLAVHEVIWDLIVQRVLTVRYGGTYQWAFLGLTEFGKEVVREQRWSPYDPDGYSKQLAAQAPKASQLCGIYVQEALRCFRVGCYLASAVMLGAASEGVVSNLFQRLLEAMKANGQMPEFDAYEKKLSKAHSVFEKYGEFKKRFEPLRGKLPGHLNDDLDLQLDGVFNLIRYYRNSSGHPTGTAVGRTAAFTSLVLFVPYCKRIEDVGDWIEKHARELHQ